MKGQGIGLTKWIHKGSQNPFKNTEKVSLHLKRFIYLPGEADWSQLCVGPGEAPSDRHESGRT